MAPSSDTAARFALVEGSPDGFLAFERASAGGDPTALVCIHANAAAARLLARAPEECRNVRMSGLLPGVDEASFAAIEEGAVLEREHRADLAEAKRWLQVRAWRSGEMLTVALADVSAARGLTARAAVAAALNAVLVRVNEAIAGETDLEKIVQTITDESTAICRAQFGAFFYNVTNDQGAAYLLYTLSGAPKEAFAGFPLPRATPLFAGTFRGERVVRIADVRTDPRYGAWGAQPRGHLPVASYLAVPVVSRGGKVYGGLLFGHAEPGVFTEEDEKNVEAIALQAAVALDNASLIKEVHRARADAQSERDRLQRLFQQAPIGVAFTRGPEHVFELVSAGHQEIVGRDRVLIGRNPRSAFPDGRGFGMADELDRVYKSRERLVRSEASFIRGDAPHEEQLFLDVVIEPMLDAEGQTEGLLLIAIDVTARVRARDRLSFLSDLGEALGGARDPQALLHTLAKLTVPRVADWTWIDVFDDPRRATRVEVEHDDPAGAPVAAALSAYPLDLDLEHPSNEVLAHGRALLLETVTDDLLRRGSQSDEHYQLVASMKARSALLVPLRVHGRVRGMVTLVVTDRSGRRYGPSDRGLAEEIGRRASLALENATLFADAEAERTRAEQANRAKDEFLAMVSHELRTPLNAMLGWVRLLRTGALAAEKHGRALETIERNARAQAQLVDDVLDVSRIVTGKLRLDVGEVDVAQIIESAIDVVRPAAEAKDVRLQPALDPDAGTIRGDPDRLQQICWNLLTNAVKFTPRGGRVTVRLERERGMVVLIVEDTGQGIHPSFLPYVFERFRQADGAITRVHGGLGLGLAIVKHLVELHGGTIEAFSDGEGKGARFDVRLPVTSLHATPHAPAVGLRETGELDTFAVPPGLRGARVLVLDDEPDARELLEAVLAQCGAVTRTAASVRDALELLDRETFDVVVSDIGMPEEDGYSFVRSLRARTPESGGRTPAIALTAYARAEDRTRALLAGFSSHLSKPVDPGELLAVIANVTGRFALPVEPDA